MGIDTSFHPVDVPLVRERLLPFIAGEGGDDGLDDLLDRAVRIRRTQHRAKQWAIAALKAARDGGSDLVHSELHVWGRPFLIAGDDPGQVAADVLRWRDTPREGADELAREMIARIDPALAGLVRPEDEEEQGEEEMRRELSWRLCLLRAAGAALRAGQASVRAPDGEEHPPDELLCREVPLIVVAFAAALTPGWMSRGYTWPTGLCDDAGIATPAFHEPTALFSSLRDAFPGLEWFSHPTIVENYMVGGMVDADDVPAARAFLIRERATLLASAEREDWAEACAVELDKIDEALALAERLGFGFCEATEIYSGPMGWLN